MKNYRFLRVASWRSGSASDCKRDGCGFDLDRWNELLLRAYEIHHSTRNIFKTELEVRNGVTLSLGFFYLPVKIYIGKRTQKRKTLRKLLIIVKHFK